MVDRARPLLVRPAVARGAARRLRRPLRAAVAVALVLAVGTACVPPTPDRQAWRSEAGRTVDDVASEVATARRVLGTVQDSHLFATTARVMAVEAEEAAGTAAQGFSAAQPPPTERRSYDDVTAALQRATSLLADVRIAVRAGDEASYGRLVDQLDRVRHRLDRVARSLQ